MRLTEVYEKQVPWLLWGPYLSERQWGTVPEDYSADGAAWDYLPHDHARSKTYRWGEDGLAGISDESQRLCFAPVNFLLIESLRTFHRYFGDDFRVECSTGSGHWMTLADVADEISHRLIAVFERDGNGNRPVYGGTEVFQKDAHWQDYLLFYEYFHGDNGAGLGASHQTGWTGLVANLIHQQQT